MSDYLDITSPCSPCGGRGFTCATIITAVSGATSSLRVRMVIPCSCCGGSGETKVRIRPTVVEYADVKEGEEE